MRSEERWSPLNAYFGQFRPCEFVVPGSHGVTLPKNKQRLSHSTIYAHHPPPRGGGFGKSAIVLTFGPFEFPPLKYDAEEEEAEDEDEDEDDIARSPYFPYMNTATAKKSKPFNPNHKRTSSPPSSDILFDNWTPNMFTFPLKDEETAEDVLSALHSAELLVARPSSSSRTTLPFTIWTINRSLNFTRQIISRGQILRSTRPDSVRACPTKGFLRCQQPRGGISP